MPPNHSATTSTASTQKDMASTFDVYRCWEPVPFLPTTPHVRSTQACSPRGEVGFSRRIRDWPSSVLPANRSGGSTHRIRPHGGPAEGHQVGRSHSPPDSTRATTISTMAGDQGRLRHLKSLAVPTVWVRPRNPAANPHSSSLSVLRPEAQKCVDCGLAEIVAVKLRLLSQRLERRSNVCPRHIAR